MPEQPSVTEILAPYCDFSGVPAHVLDHAAKRGTAVHKVCEAIATGLWAPPLDEDETPYVESFKSWFRTTVDEVIACEVELVHPDYNFKGHPDLICRIKGDTALAVVDYKTPQAAQKSWKLQLAAYRQLCLANGYDVQRRFCLRLRKHGGAPIVDESIDHAVEWNLFLNARSLFQYFHGR